MRLRAVALGMLGLALMEPEARADCGDGLLEPDAPDFEVCDDGNTSDDDSCLSSCTYAKPIFLPPCDPSNGEVELADETSVPNFNDLSKRFFCLSPGDYTGWSSSVTTLTTSGTSGTPRVIQLNPASMLFDDHPARIPESAQAVLGGLRFQNGASHWLIDRLSFEGPDEGESLSALVNIDAVRDAPVMGSAGIVLNRLLARGGGGGGGQVRMQGVDPVEDNFLQHSVLNESGLVRIPDAGPNGEDLIRDTHCSTVQNGNRIVSNENYDCAGDGVQVTADSVGRVVVADNDIKHTAGFGDGETGIAIKGTGQATPEKWMRFENDRSWDISVGVVCQNSAEQFREQIQRVEYSVRTSISYEFGTARSG